ncbi:MAG TPA: hypothetical protein VK507_00385 [Iamia sp.]|nr:hypothetical protein [Iamia sp.]
MRRSLRSAFVLGVLAGLVVALVRALAREGRPGPAPLAAPAPPLPAGTTPARTRTPAPVEVVAPPPVAAPVEVVAPPPVAAPVAPAAPAAPEPTPSTAPPSADTGTGVAPVDGACPDGFPIKAKEASGIYHRPGGLSYERTRPDRCYADEAAAEADGFRAAKR